jgi:hypothetical protein
VSPEARVEVNDEHCVACEVELRDDEQGRPVCGSCDRQLEVEVAAYLASVAVCRAPE